MLENRTAKKRLLVLASTFPRWKDDTEPRFVLDLSNQLAKSFDVTVLAPFSPGSAVSERLENVEVRRFKYAFFDAWSVLTAPGSILGNLKQRPWLALLLPLFFLRQIWAIHRTIAHGNFDGIHVHWIVPQALSFWVVRWFQKTPPFIVTAHGGDTSVTSLPLVRQLAKFALGQAKAVTVVAEHLRPKVPEATHVLPMGVDLSRFAAISGEGPPRIFFIGRLAKKKGVDVLLKAAGLLPQDVSVHIIGDGEERNALESLNPRAIFYGSLAHDQIVSSLRSTDIICLPFRSSGVLDADGTPTVLLEMAAAGLVIVASDVPAVTQALSEHSIVRFKEGSVESLGARLSELLAQPDLRQKYIEECQQSVRRYDWVSVGRKYSALFD